MFLFDIKYFWINIIFFFYLVVFWCSFGVDERGFGGGMYFFNVVFLGKIFWYCCGSSEWGGVKYDVIMVFVMCFCCKKRV